MPTPTYDLIEEKVLGSAQASVTFSSIPGTYKHLEIEFTGTVTAALGIRLQYNGDTATNYSWTYQQGDGTSATSGRASTQASTEMAYFTSGSLATATARIFDYTSTNVNKTHLSRGSQASFIAQAFVGLWRKTPETITSVTVLTTTSTFASGCTFRLWGVAG